MFFRLLFLLLLSLPVPLRAAAPDRPSVLFFFADDWGRYAGTYARLESRPSLSQVIKTPRIDAIAERGVTFRHAFVNSPSCTPCRSSLMSGRYFFNTGRGAVLVAQAWEKDIPSWPLLLQESGYHLGETGKVWSPGTPSDAPIGAGKYGYEKRGMTFNGFGKQATRRVQAGATVEEARRVILAQVRDNFDDFLKARPAGQPFCYFFGPTNVHRIWEKGSGPALWGIRPDDIAGKLPPFLPDVPEIRADVADGLGEVMALDAMLGVLLDRLQETGELDGTLIVISSDHGMAGVPRGKCNLYDFGTAVPLIMAGPGVAGVAGGRVAEDFTLLMDLAPTLLETAGIGLPSGMDGKSLVPVLRYPVSGQADPARLSVVTGRERHAPEAREGNLPYPQRALRTREFLYIRNYEPDRWPMGDPYGVTETSAPAAAELEENTFVAFADFDASPTKAWMVGHRNDSSWQRAWQLSFAKRPGEELYDLAGDPDQMNNVADDPAYAATLTEYAGRLRGILTAAGDPRLASGPVTFEQSPFTDSRTPVKAKKP